MNKKIAVLGSTGSVGRQALSVIAQLGYKVSALCAGQNVKLLIEQIKQFSPEIAAIENENAKEELQDAVKKFGLNTKVFAGKTAAQFAAVNSSAEIVLNAVVGFAGLNATLAALNAKKTVALANKESVVCAGQLVVNAAKKAGVNILPVDSEHSAIFQCLQNRYDKKSLSRIILTASGGPFLGKTKQQLKNVTKNDALKHPNWNMGAKISIDSATMMNKGLELIEAMWLFDIEPQNIDIIVQKQSIIHSMVQFSDNSILAQMGVPDMRLPIQYALTWPQRTLPCVPKLNFEELSVLNFEKADDETFCALRACKLAAQKGGLAPCAASAANEAAVELFLQDKIGFLDIGQLVEEVVQSDSFGGDYNIADVYECDAAARKFVFEKVKNIWASPKTRLFPPKAGKEP
jgi:1-deoxy-D-xylulose-5-phosphate reductoisomerase